MAYRELQQGAVANSEHQITEYWNSINLLEQSIASREGQPSFVFFEGPPTANGRPGIHHVLARALKDAVCRFKTMEGYQVKRKAGWDTHGLPVEIEVEKRIGLADKQAIESFGIGNFNKACRDSVFEYEGLWREMTEKMAYLVDLDNPYITLDNEYIESVWWILDKFFKEDYIYEGHKILPYCPRCGTGLASHEVAQGYMEKKTTTVIAKFKALDEDAYYLVWTTTPWTLAANVALTVNPQETYLKVKFEDTVYYIEKNLAPKVIEGEYEVLGQMLGSELEHRRYEQLMPFVKAEKDCFYVTLGDYVTTEDGTGIVHTAPAFGEDDYQLGVKYGLPVLQPVNEEGKYTTTPWEGMFVMDADIEILKWLAHEGKLFKKQRIEHNYPHCWRCKTPLLYYAKPSWYIEMTRLKDQLIANNNTVNWYPGYVGEKRFGNWLENLNDWAISRSRYWGTPLNIWRCDNKACNHISSVGSIEELQNRAIENVDASIDLHRPAVDDVHLKCDRCESQMTRVPDVIDCWFDSGAMPFAQHHYPFENKEKFDTLYPADFICEGIDQTRGWFYSLIAISTFVMGQSPYKNVLVNDLVVDKHGKKMSKSRGNTVDAFQLLNQYGADATRWYMYYVSPAWQPTKFDEDGLREISSKFFGTLKNSYTFFTLYANADQLDVASFDIPVGDRPEIDRWMLSKLNRLVKGVNEDFAVFDLTKATRKIQEFVVEDLSNWYIRRSRRRFWATELTDDKKAVYKTTYEVLETVARLIAPLAPYLSEEIYQNLTGGVSVHLASYPKAQLDLLDDTTEARMDLVRDLVGLGRAAREAVKIKVRQPIAKVLVDGSHEGLIGDLVALIEEELNVKKVVFEAHLDQFMNFSLKPNFKTAGPLLGKRMGAFTKALGDVNAAEWAPKFAQGETLALTLEGEGYSFNQDHVQVSITAKEGFTVEMANNLFVILDTTLNEALIAEGYAREFVSRIQQMRKASGFEVMDEIHIQCKSTPVFEQAIEAYRDYIMQETLAKTLVFSAEGDFETYDLNGEATQIRVTKA